MQIPGQPEDQERDTRQVESCNEEGQDCVSIWRGPARIIHRSRQVPIRAKKDDHHDDHHGGGMGGMGGMGGGMGDMGMGGMGM